MLRLASSRGGRILIYVWAIEQDDASKRVIPQAETKSVLYPASDHPQTQIDGVDVLVPWVHNITFVKAVGTQATTEGTPVYKRYYHMFSNGELRHIVTEAATNLSLQIGSPRSGGKGISILQEGWERSNYYIELRLWQED
jgi:tRNA (uracil-5-)-methyltransferase TRM9